MKTCNNCSAENHLAAKNCIQCNMKNNFSFQEMPDEAPEADHDYIHCRNCAAEIPLSSLKCAQCNFPVQHQLKVKHTIAFNAAKANLKIS